MKSTTFKAQIDKLYGKNADHKRAVEKELYSKKDFLKIADCLMDDEKIEAIAPIADNPKKTQREKTSFLRNWYIILTNKRMMFVSPTLVLQEMTTNSYRYSDITSLEAAKWNSIHIKIASSLDMLSITGSYLYYEQRDELLHIIEKHMYL